MKGLVKKVKRFNETDITENTVIIKIKAKHLFNVFPKSPAILGEGGNDFGVTVWEVSEVIEGNFLIGARITLTGNFTDIIEDKNIYNIVAKEVEHPQYGKQYEKLTMVEDIDFSKIENQKGFLSVFLTEMQIEEMYKILENPLLSIANHDVEELKKVKGIGDYIANAIIGRFEKYRDNSKVYIELDGMGLTTNFIERLISVYGNNPNTIIKKVKETPYDLIWDMDGVGFKTADGIALTAGILPKSVERIKGFIYYYLNVQGESGNSYVYASDLTAEIFYQFDGKENILEVYRDENNEIIDNNINKAIQELQEEGKLILEDNEIRIKRRVYLKKYYDLEKNIAFHIKRLLEAENEFEYKDWEDVLAKQEEKQGWTFTEEQRQGIKLGLDSQVCFITGGAGTGKSSLVSGILQVLQEYKFAQCSLAGKAAARLKEVTGEDGYTIHRLLGYNPSNLKINGSMFTYNDYLNSPLPYDIIILDEISLIGGEIFLDLIKAIPNGAKLIMLGDMGQLESIGCLNLASDIYHSEIVPKVELTKVHRQAQKSGIITTSHLVRNEEPIFERGFEGEEVIGELEDMILDIYSESDESLDKVMKHFMNWYNHKLVDKDIMKIQVISPVKERGNACVFNLNTEIQRMVNPKPEIDFNESISIKISDEKIMEIREHDKVMCIVNQYQLLTVDGEKVDVFNGWTGLVHSIRGSLIEIYFPIIDEYVLFTEEKVRNSITLGYASTCHKMQGSSNTVIIGVIDYSTPPQMRTKELLYTLITRAEKICVLAGQRGAINESIKKSGISNKQTFLPELLLLEHIEIEKPNNALVDNFNVSTIQKDA